MKKLAELRQERAQKITAQTALTNEVRTAKREFTEEEETRFDALTTEIEDLDKQITRAVKIDEAEKRQAGLNGTPVDTSVSNKGEEREVAEVKKRASVARAIRMVTSGETLDGAEKEMNDVAIEESRDAGVNVPKKALVNIPMSMLRAVAHTVSEDAGAYGGALVVDQAPRVQMPFTPKTFLEKLGANVLRNLKGGSLPLPVMSNGSWQWLGETETMTINKGAIGGPSLEPHRVGDAVSISNRLLLQSSPDAEALVRQILYGGYDRALNAAAINGPGTGNAPTGILNTVGIQESSVVAGTAASRALVLELVSLLESADSTEEALGFLMNPSLRYILQTTLLDAGSGRFVMESKNELQGYAAAISTLVPDLAGNKVLTFGDWSKLFVGEWGSVSILTDPYSDSLADSVRVVANAHAGVAIAQPNAFAVNKFLTA